ncbi:DUF1405 domain-containing protein [Paenibacillus sp. sptzw28]|uniref:DUF1405 domain-containing protein n=1 Tax=Paenibacillus sp. sptzw28 TaxID=715179 RepID=UPI001C6E979B|nr:DUF1405 domain-containing protein [Paenibacillus sp. sptzw28]QYR19882.1 DUF1405 domain-containing protein [Paenibacillus sp. sptzw28]
MINPHDERVAFLPSISFFWSRSFLTSRIMLWTLLLVNTGGTVYGYIWYGNQIEYTISNHPLWQVIFVPDSPTASLFFTLSLLFLLFPAAGKPSAAYIALRSIIEALAVVTSIKYGIWAVSMIVAGGAQGDPLVWQDYMLMVSHLGMAIEALLFVRFMIFGRTAAVIALIWLLANDTVDYTFNVFPWLPKVLNDELGAIRTFTIGLSIFSLLVTNLAMKFRKV